MRPPSSADATYERRCDIEASKRQTFAAPGGAAVVGGAVDPPQPDATATVAPAAARKALERFGESVLQSPAFVLALAHLARVRDRDGREQRLRVLVLRVRVDVLGWPDL